jgi:hypothetical protein
VKTEARLQEIIERSSSENVVVVSSQVGGHLSFADMTEKSLIIPDYWINTFFRVYTDFLLKTHNSHDTSDQSTTTIRQQIPNGLPHGTNDKPVTELETRNSEST